MNDNKVLVTCLARRVRTRCERRGIHVTGGTALNWKIEKKKQKFQKALTSARRHFCVISSVRENNMFAIETKVYLQIIFPSAFSI